MVRARLHLACRLGDEAVNAASLPGRRSHAGRGQTALDPSIPERRAAVSAYNAVSGTFTCTFEPSTRTSTHATRISILRRSPVNTFNPPPVPGTFNPVPSTAFAQRSSLRGAGHRRLETCRSLHNARKMPSTSPCDRFPAEPDPRGHGDVVGVRAHGVPSQITGWSRFVSGCVTLW